MRKKGQTLKGITKKHAKLKYWKDRMVIEGKGYANFIIRKNMKYDGMNKDEVNSNGKHQ